MNNIQKLAQMGCGNEILNSCVDRANLSAAIYNANMFYKYCKQSLKSGTHKSPESCYHYIASYYNRLLELMSVAETYKDLYGEKYFKVKLSIEKLFLI